MKTSTLKVKSKSLKVTTQMAEDIRNGKCIIKPLLSKEILAKGDYLFLKEPTNEINTFTTKNNAKTFVRVKSNKVFKLQDITSEDICVILKDSNMESFAEYWNDLIKDMSCEMNTQSASNKFIRSYNYDANPNVELLECDVLDTINN